MIVQAVNELSYTKGKDVLIFINSNVSANVKCEYKIEKAQATIVIIDSTRQSWEWTRVRITREKFSVYTRRNYSDESSVYDLKEVAVTSSLSREPTMHYTCESIYLTASTIFWLLIIMHASYVNIFSPRW